MVSAGPADTMSLRSRVVGSERRSEQLQGCVVDLAVQPGPYASKPEVGPKRPATTLNV